MTESNAKQVRMLGVGAVIGLLLLATGTASTMSIVVAFTIVISVGLFLFPKPTLAVIGVFLLVQPVLVNMAGSSLSPLGLAIHRLHQAFTLAVALRIVMFLSWEHLAARLRLWFWLIGAFVALGVISGLLQGVPPATIALGAFLAIKFPIFFLAAMTVSWDERDCERLVRGMLWLGPLFFGTGVLIWMLPSEVQAVFMDETLETDTYGREQFGAMQGIFTHPGVFGWAAAAAGCYAVAVLLAGRPGWRALATGSVVSSVSGILASLRRRPLLALPAVALYGIVRFARGGRRWTVLALFTILGIGVAWLEVGRLEVQYRDAMTYIDPTAPTAPRVLLYVAGTDIATSRFPLGAGFGRFGGYAATLNYSPLYDQYGFTNIWGLSAEAPHYLQDTYWPHIAAETGWIGAAILFVFYLLLLERVSRAALRATEVGTKTLAVAAALVLAEGLIESLAGPVFEVALFAYAIAIPLGMTLARAEVMVDASPRDQVSIPTGTGHQ